ncbi:Hcp family type VI secretion system effector [Variovorax sp. RB3P1]|uniref:Hcp family type VI secretion system effector n=1 Tax=Variovorax sp. RB3P1 TaxID=3443732 RepID=UPI003F4472E3
MRRMLSLEALHDDRAPSAVRQAQPHPVSRHRGGAGKATVEDLEFDHYVDRSSPNLMKYCLTGKHVQEAKLTVRKAGGNPLEYLKFTFSDVIITAIQPFGSNADEMRVKERVRLSFSKIKQEYAVQNAQGGSGGAVTAGYDIKGNKES